jgi:broad specificity phosphatase PhoE
MFYVKGSEQEKSGWLESHREYMDRVKAFLAELKSSCADSEPLADSGKISMRAMLRYVDGEGRDRIERGSATKNL